MTAILGQPNLCTDKNDYEHPQGRYYEGRKYSRRVVQVIPHPKYAVKRVPRKAPQIIYDFALLKVK